MIRSSFKTIPISGAAVLALLVAGVSELYAQPGAPPFGHRLGTRVDSLDVAYFGLFPGVAGVAEATAERQGQDSTRIRIRRSLGADTSVTASNEAMGELGRFIDSYEEAVRGGGDVRWSVLRGLAGTAGWPAASADEYTVTDMEGDPWHGRIALVDDSVLLLWTGGSDYAWRNASSLKALRAEDIARIERRGSMVAAVAGATLIGGATGWIGQYLLTEHPSIGGILPGVIWGITTGFGAGQLSGYDAVINGRQDQLRLAVPHLARTGIFNRGTPREVRLSAASAASPAPPPTRIQPEPRRSRFHIQVGAGYHFLSQASTFTTSTESYPGAPATQRTADTVTSGGTSAVSGIGLEYSVIGPLRIGTFVRIGARQGDPKLRESFSMSITGGGASFVVTEPGPFPHGRIELSAGAGAASASINGTGSITLYDYSNPGIYHFQGNTTLMYLRADIGLYASRTMSFHVLYDWMSGAPMDVQKQEVEAELGPFDHPRYGYAEAHAVDVSGHMLTFGFKIHL